MLRFLLLHGRLLRLPPRGVVVAIAPVRGVGHLYAILLALVQRWVGESVIHKSAHVERIRPV
jgi:hypothetical protein